VNITNPNDMQFSAMIAELAVTTGEQQQFIHYHHQ
jgi:hypothetical protein